MTGESRGFSQGAEGFLELRRGIQASSCVGPGKSNLPFELVLINHRVLIKSAPGNHSLLACGTTRELRLKFPRETGLILKCPVMVGNPLQTKQGK